METDGGFFFFTFQTSVVKFSARIAFYVQDCKVLVVVLASIESCFSPKCK